MPFSENVWKSLFECCREEKTGSLFIATQDNKAGQVVIVAGRLIGVAYAGHCNAEAIEQLELAGELRFSFTPDVQFPIKDKLTPEAAQTLLSAMGYHLGAEESFFHQAEKIERDIEEGDSVMEDEQQAHDTLWETAKVGTVERLYRGHKILEEPEPSQSKERFYRGKKVIA